jgi:hypothetical protein
MHRDSGEVSYHMLRYKSGVIRCAAGNQVYTRQTYCHLYVEVEVFEKPFGMIDPFSDGIMQRDRLFIYLFQHKMLIPFLFRHGRRPVDFYNIVSERYTSLAVQGCDLNALARKSAELFIFEEDELSCIGKDSRNIRGDKELLLAAANNKRTALADRINGMRVCFTHNA